MWLSISTSKKHEICNLCIETIYVGTYRPTSFETVAAGEESSRNTIRRLFGVEKNNLATLKENFMRGYNFFFKLPHKDKKLSTTQVSEIKFISKSP